MALADPGSGRFVPVRDWTCSKHDQPDYHECDCGCCAYEECEECERSEWVDRVDEQGEVVMRELGAFETFLMDQAGKLLAHGSIFSASQLGVLTPSSGATFEWSEDNLIPRVVQP